MSFRRSLVEKIIPEELLEYSECKISMGEDKIISMLASMHGKLIFFLEICLIHPVNESTYFQNVRSFTLKTTLSRLYLSKIYAQVNHKIWCKEKAIFYYFTLWRFMIAILSWSIKPSNSRKEKFKGVWDGLWLSITLPKQGRRLTPDVNWQTEIEKDIEASNIG